MFIAQNEYPSCILSLENLGLSTNDVISFQSFDVDHPDGKKHSI